MHPRKGASRMSAIAKGTFTVEMQPQSEPNISDGVSLGRMSLEKTFACDLAATSRGEMLTALTPVKGSAGYVAIERVTGTLSGRSGSFVFQHTGTVNSGAQQLSIAVVPDSGTGALTGIFGTFKLNIVEGNTSTSSSTRCLSSRRSSRMTPNPSFKRTRSGRLRRPPRSA
jgi:hypothetical protein